MQSGVRDDTCRAHDTQGLKPVGMYTVPMSRKNTVKKVKGVHGTGEYRVVAEGASRLVAVNIRGLNRF
ncbi:hypothetical protein NDU88_007880 [Pleurodeles waltl]|uniref:Uncharacterized protein n=1 Tax=Pleurodeles waltl TaxID=8319 RepID=A0AAV7RT19_PLEWA|nr:hypothetical protein NDU88_007880 [Pleurodeles waltl]